jgi:propionate CoA-transferase
MPGAPLAAKRDQQVLYVTERCVFRLANEGLELIEVAPGIDIESDILAHMDFSPIVRDPKKMDSRIFLPEQMDLKSTLLDLRLEDRVSYDPRRNVLFVNLQNLHVQRREDVAEIREVLAGIMPLAQNCSALLTCPCRPALLGQRGSINGKDSNL